MGGVGRSVSLSVVGRSRRYDETCVSYLDSRRDATERRRGATRPREGPGVRGRALAGFRARSRRDKRARGAVVGHRAVRVGQIERARAPRVVGRIREKDEAGAVATGGAPHPANRAVLIATHGTVIRTFDVEGAPSRRVHAYLGHGYPRHRARGLALERGGTSLHNPPTFLLLLRGLKKMVRRSWVTPESTARAARPPPKTRGERRPRPPARAIGAPAAAPTPLASRGAARAAREVVETTNDTIG